MFIITTLLQQAVSAFRSLNLFSHKFLCIIFTVYLICNKMYLVLNFTVAF